MPAKDTTAAKAPRETIAGLLHALNHFTETLDTAGGRHINGIPDGIALSRATNLLYNALGAAVHDAIDRPVIGLTLIQAVDSISRAVGVPADRWNEKQERCPGG